MVSEGTFVPLCHVTSFHPVRAGNRRAVSDLPAIPADGHAVAKFHRHALELYLLSLFQPHAVHVGEDKVPVLPVAHHFLQPHTEGLRGIVHVEVRRIPKVNAHVDGVTNTLSTLQHLHLLPKFLPEFLPKLVAEVVVGFSVVSVVVTVVVVSAVAVALNRRNGRAIHRRNRAQTRVPLGIPYHRVHLREATPPKVCQVSNKTTEDVIRNASIRCVGNSVVNWGSNG